MSAAAPDRARTRARRSRSTDRSSPPPDAGARSAAPGPPVPDPPDAGRTRRGAVAWSDGLRAEQAACERLQARGWHILARRARTAAGEIDIVAECRGLLAFVEVKARPTLADAACSLSARQCRRLLDAAAILLAANPHWPRARVRFDLVLVDRAGGMRRIADAFRQEEADHAS